MAAANPWMWLVLVCLTTSCTTPPPSEPPSPETTVAMATGQKAALSTDAAKIALPIRQVIQKMQAEGVTAENASVRSHASYSHPWVRVDEAGRIQAHILVTQINAERLSQLREFHVQIDKHSEPSIIQGWIPFDRVEQVAEMSFVREIRAPRYAVRR